MFIIRCGLKRNLGVRYFSTNLDKNLAKRIMASHFDSSVVSCPHSADWKHDSMYCHINNQWVKVTMNHVAYNGPDALRIYIQHKEKVKTALMTGTLIFPFPLEDNDCWVDAVVATPGKSIKYIGRKDIKAKDLLYDFHVNFKNDFYIPVNMSHCFDGEPIILNYIIKRNATFDDSWDEIRRMKKNENNWLFDKNERWKDYMAITPGWVTISPIKGETEPMFGNDYNYDPVNLQGLTLYTGDMHSYWSFSFYAQPDLKEFLIKKYDLKTCVV